MATQSILKNIVINEPNAIEAFISAMEKASDAADHSNPHSVESEDLSGEDLKKFLKTIKRK